MIVSSSKYEAIVVYDLYRVCIPTSALFLCDMKGSHPGGACDVCHDVLGFYSFVL
jgi:hypothetical protein